MNEIKVFMETSCNHKNGVLALCADTCFEVDLSHWWMRVVMSECGRNKYAGNEPGGVS